MGTHIWLCTYWLIYFVFWYVSPFAIFWCYIKNIFWYVFPVPGEGNGYPLQYSGLENSMDCIVHGVAKSRTWLSDCHFLSFLLSMCCVLCLVTQSCTTLCNPMDYSQPVSSVHGDSPGKNTGVDCHALVQVIFPTQGWNPGLPHCMQILYHLSQQGSQRILKWVAYFFFRGTS